jgi:hypothetical protein
MCKQVSVEYRVMSIANIAAHRLALTCGNAGHARLAPGAVLVSLLAATGPAFAGAWTLKSGDGQVILGTILNQAHDAFDGQGNANPTPRYRKIEAQALLEYGVTDKLTVMLGPGFQHIDIAPPVSAERRGAGYTEFGARFRFLESEDWVFSLQGLMRAPGTSDTNNPAAVGYTGMEFDARILLGGNLSIAGLPAFVDVELAQRFRDTAPDEFRADATLGIRMAPQWQIWLQSFTVIAESGSELFPVYNYSKLQLSAIYDINKDWSAQLGAFATLFGHNALQENGLVAALCYRF